MSVSSAAVLPRADGGTRQATRREAACVWGIAAATALLHLAVAGRYDALRNELYFIICGRHPDFGYVDQPPLVPLLAAATQAFGVNIWLLRLPAAAAAIALVPLTAAFAKLVGGNTLAVVLAAAAAALAPALAFTTATLTTATFEPLAWTASAYLLARAVLRDERRALLLAGLVVGVALEAKYGVVMWLLPLAAGLLLTPARRVLGWRECWLGIAIAAAIAAPNVIWQAAHGWPFFAVVSRHAPTDLTGGPIGFEIQQILALNPLLAPLWLAGVVAPFLVSRLRSLRFLSIAFVGATAINIAAGGKDYYLFAAYPPMFAVGAVALAGLPGWAAGAWLAGAAAGFTVLAPLALPILDPPALDRYLQRTHLRPPPDEVAAIGAPLTQFLSDQLGWRALEQQIAAIYRALPAAEQAKAAIVASNYGEAAAIDFYGRPDALPPALTGQNQYFLWGSHGYDGSVVIHINGDPMRWRNFCDSVAIVATFGVPYAMPYENGRPIFVCRGMHANLSQTWDRFKRFR